MAGKKDPSIYDERTSIGSADELDEYGVWVKSEPQDLSNSMPDIEELPNFDEVSTNDLEMPDLDSSLDTDFGIIEESSPGSLEIEFEEIPESSDLPEGPAPVNIDRDGFTEVSMTDFLENPAEEKLVESIDFGDLDSAASEIEPVEPYGGASYGAAQGGAAQGGKDLSTQLLQRIADELSSIKKEISSLKNELSVVRGEIKSSEGAASQGFFDEEDDEKIALTGDEMDNILNTASFTEETGFDETAVSFDDGTGENAVIEEKNDEMVEISFDEELSELEGPIKVEDELKISGTDDFDISLDLSPDAINDTSELDILREEGALPITEAPEDTSYLEEDPLASLDTSVEEIGSADTFSQAIDFDESPASEPGIDNISIDLDMEDAALMDKPSGTDDFIFETEDTMELPAEELPDIDEAILPIESSMDDLLPETGPGIDFKETVPKGLYEATAAEDSIPANLKQELKIVLSYMDQLLESLPDDKIEEFAQSEYFDTYKKLFEELGLV